MAKAPKNAAASTDENWEDEPEVVAIETVSVKCVSHDSPHDHTPRALKHGEVAEVEKSVAEKLVASGHVILHKDAA